MNRSLISDLIQPSLFPGEPDMLKETLSSGRIMARSLAVATATSAERLSLARLFCYHAAAFYWQAIGGPSPVRTLFSAIPTVKMPEQALPLADRMGTMAAQLPPEQAIYELGLTYNVMLPDEWRSAYGVYYTPPVLAERLLDQATQAGVDWSTCRALDPACGGGAFLAPVARRMKDAAGQCSPALLLKNIATRLHGYEIDPFSAWLSQLALDAVLLPVSKKARRPVPVQVKVCDALEQTPPAEGFDLVVGNPPYGRVKLDVQQRERYKRSIYGHANLYGLFTDLALHHTRKNGVVAYVTPTSFLAGRYFKNLRALLASETAPTSIDFVTERKGVFDSVLQETLLACYRKNGKRKLATVHTLTPISADKLRIESVGKFQLPLDGSTPWIIPRSGHQSVHMAHVNTLTHRLRDYGYGVSTGPLVWNRHKDQLYSTAGKGRLPLIWAEAVTSDGRFLFRAEKRGHQPYFEPRRGDDWLIVTAPCILLQRTTSKEQKRRLITAELPLEFIEQHGGAVVENHLNMVRPLDDKPAVSQATLRALLDSMVVDSVFRCLSGSVAVSAYELESLPLPPPASLKRLDKLVRSNAGPEAIDAECARLYGLDTA
ncbi:HsdM family class I SAM-dependent methyltransferase [Sulfurivermis fontis]|uniref:HsdM family class I SAM-dependent methyltransferase n=1 Tax=Sulfurivermis fontis TaxID=1972068 RepID=UPI0018D4F0D3|nr:N-6 DNA methylase [Sulfurivermis fontis]